MVSGWHRYSVEVLRTRTQARNARRPQRTRLRPRPDLCSIRAGLLLDNDVTLVKARTAMISRRQHCAAADSQIGCRQCLDQRRSIMTEFSMRYT